MSNERDHILKEITRLYQETGRSPGIAVFVKSSGIPSHRILGVYWSRWSDALAEAGLSSNQLTPRFDSNKLLEGLALYSRKIGRYPSQADLKIGKRQGEDLANPDVYSAHFGNASHVRQSLIDFCKANKAFADVISLVPLPANNSQNQKAPANGHVYLLQSGDHFKIGRSDNLERRFKEISISLPAAVTLIHSISTDDPAGIEAYWHRRFADRRANGEWFKLARDDVAAFRRRKFQ